MDEAAKDEDSTVEHQPEFEGTLKESGYRCCRRNRHPFDRQTWAEMVFVGVTNKG